MTSYVEPPVYYGGFDPGSGRAGLFLIPKDQVELVRETLTIASLIATGSPQTLLKRGDIDATLADVLREGECLIEWQNTAYYLCDLIKEGKNVTAAFNDPGRYWGDHARILLLALSAMLIPESTFELRLVTALPITLYERENRKRMKDALSNVYEFRFNGRRRQAIITVGYVAMEGQGILIHAGAASGEQALLDIGERTVDAIAADGQRLITTLCRGNEELGIGHLTDALQQLAQRYERVLPPTRAHELLWAWAHSRPLPTIRAKEGAIPEREIHATIDIARHALAKDIFSFVSSLWNVEGEAVGERFEQILLGGGGVHYVGDLLRELLPRVVIPSDPEDANMRGYAELALTLADKIPNVWELD